MSIFYAFKKKKKLDFFPLFNIVKNVNLLAGLDVMHVTIDLENSMKSTALNFQNNGSQ